jgi:hypothetical protein
MSGDSSSDDGQGEEYLENDWCSTAGGKDKRMVVVNGISLPRCRRGGLCRKGFGECGLCERCMCVCAGGTRKEKWNAVFFPNGVGRRGRRTGSKNNEGSTAAAIGAPRNVKRSAAAAGLDAMRTQSRDLAKGSDGEGNDDAAGEVFFRACMLRHF